MTQNLAEVIYSEGAKQDVEDPVWESEVPYIGNVNDPTNMHESGEAEPFRNRDGNLEFIQWIREGILNFFDAESDTGQQFRPRRQDPRALRVMSRAANRIRTTTYKGVTDSLNIELLRPDLRRVRAVIVNYGPGNLGVSYNSQSSPDVATVRGNQFLVLPSGVIATTPDYYPLELFTTDALWGMSVTAAQDCMVSVLEEVYED